MQFRNVNMKVQLAMSQTVNGSKVSNITITIMKPLEPAPDLHFYHMMEMFTFSLFLFCLKNKTKCCSLVCSRLAFFEWNFQLHQGAFVSSIGTF